MKTENQNVQLEKKSFLKAETTKTKKATMKALSLKPSRSLKKSNGLKSIALKLK